jgi:hypothetical protein
MKKVGLYYICECGKKIPIGNLKTNIQTYEHDFAPDETRISIEGICPECNEDINISFSR